MTKVIIVDDHEIIREGLKLILKEENNITVVGEAKNGEEALARVKKLNFDIMILDMNMPGKSGIELISEIKKIKTDVHILVLSIHQEDSFALRAIKSGASGYLSKDTALEELVLAINTISEKGRYISKTLAESIAFNLINEDEIITPDQLSKREMEILKKIATGIKVKDIADEFGLSVSTVFTYRQRILDKLNLKGNVELTHYAINNHLI